MSIKTVSSTNKSMWFKPNGGVALADNPPWGAWCRDIRARFKSLKGMRTQPRIQSVKSDASDWTSKLSAKATAPQIVEAQDQQQLESKE